MLAQDPVIPPPRLPGSLGAVRPMHARRREYMPQPAVNPANPDPINMLNVTLPGEVVRTVVVEQFSDDILVVEIASNVIGKGGATQKRGDRIAVQRSQKNALSEEWVPVSDREVREREQRMLAQQAATRQKQDQGLADTALDQRNRIAEPQPAEIAPRPTHNAGDEDMRVASAGEPVMPSTPAAQAPIEADVPTQHQSLGMDAIDGG